MATQPAVSNDINDALDNPVVRTGTSDYFGQVLIDTFFCVLVKGYGKVPFDASQHQLDQRRTSIEIAVLPLAEMNISFDVKRNMIAESREWAGIVLPSIKTLGISAQEINNKWAKIHVKETGETWQDKNTGETRKKTTFEIVELYADEAACRAAYQAFTGATPTPAPAQSTPDNGNGGKEKETAAKFLKPIIENAVRGQSDLDVIRGTVALNISNMPPVAKWFNVDSPEVTALIFEAMSK